MLSRSDEKTINLLQFLLTAVAILHVSEAFDMYDQSGEFFKPFFYSYA